MASLMCEERAGERELAWPQTPAEFAALVETAQDGLVRFAYCRLRNLADAEDVVQDALVRAYLERERLRAVAAVLPYLYRMVANRCTDLLRKRRHAGAAIEEASGLCAADPGIARLERIGALLAKLPAAQAEAIRLRVFGELSFDEAAHAEGVPVATIKSRFRYGVERLRKLMTRKEAL